MRDKEEVIEKLDDFIKSDSKHCLVIGTDLQKKHKNILVYLNKLGKKLRILVRINSMQECEYMLGSKFKTGTPKKIGNLIIYVDSMNVTSQSNTPREFSCIIVYPIGSLKGINDNNLTDILNFRKADKVFWVSNHDNIDYSYLKAICDIKDIIEINAEDDVIHERILTNNIIKENEDFDKLYVDNLSYYKVEEALNNKYNLGGVYTSSMGQELVIGHFGEYIFGGSRATKEFFIKVLNEKENEKYVLLVKQNKK